MQHKIIKQISVAFAVLLLTACVTTRTPSFDKEGTEEEKINAYANAAAKYLQKGEFELARKHLSSAMELDPKSPRIHELLAYTFRQTGELTLAEEHYRKMHKFGDGGYTRGHYNYATFLMAQKRFEESKQQLELAAQDTLYQRRSHVFRLLGICNLQLKDSKAAVAAFEQAVQIDRMDIRSMSDLSVLAWDDSDYEKAEYWYKRVEDVRSVRNLGQPSATHLLMGIRIAYRNQDADAQASNELALRNLYPKSPEYQRYKREFRK